MKSFPDGATISAQDIRYVPGGMQCLAVYPNGRQCRSWAVAIATEEITSSTVVRQTRCDKGHTFQAIGSRSRPGNGGAWGPNPLLFVGTPADPGKLRSPGC